MSKGEETTGFSLVEFQLRPTQNAYPDLHILDCRRVESDLACITPLGFPRAGNQECAMKNGRHSGRPKLKLHEAKAYGVL